MSIEKGVGPQFPADLSKPHFRQCDPLVLLAMVRQALTPVGSRELLNSQEHERVSINSEEIKTSLNHSLVARQWVGHSIEPNSISKHISRHTNMN